MKIQLKEITYEGQVMSAQQRSLLKSVLRNSNHPLSRQLYDYHKQEDYTLLIAMKSI